MRCFFYLYRFRKYVSYGFPIINFYNPGVHYETPCIKRNDRDIGVNRLRYSVIKFQKNKSSVCTIFVQNLAEHAAYFMWIEKHSEDKCNSCTRSIMHRFHCRNLLLVPNRKPPLNSTCHSQVHVLSYPNEGIYYLQGICVAVADTWRWMWRSSHSRLHKRTVQTSI
jgi:hypothetical protein